MKVLSLALICALGDVALLTDVYDYFGVLFQKGTPFGSAMLISHNTAMTTMNFDWKNISLYDLNILFGFANSGNMFTKLVRRRVPSEKSKIMALMFDEGLPDGFVAPSRMAHVSNKLHYGWLVQVLLWYQDEDGNIKYGNFEEVSSPSNTPRVIDSSTKYFVDFPNPECIELRGCAVLQSSMVVGIVNRYEDGAIIFHSTAAFREAWLQVTQPVRKVPYE